MIFKKLKKTWSRRKPTNKKTKICQRKTWKTTTTRKEAFKTIKKNDEIKFEKKRKTTKYLKTKRSWKSCKHFVN